MGLEFLLRRTPPWREVGEGILFREGDLVEQVGTVTRRSSRSSSISSSRFAPK
jgi:hypothetical protein